MALKFYQFGLDLRSRARIGHETSLNELDGKQSNCFRTGDLKKVVGRVHQLLIKCGATAQAVALAPGVNRIGRDPASDICLDDATVSGQHCEIVVLEEQILLRDLGSTNGTFINGRPIDEAPLLPGQSVHVGGVEVVLDQPVPISIPQLSFRQEMHPLLPDGFAACINHPASHGTMECTQCQKVFCDLCVHRVGLVGGPALKLCPSCSGHCRPVVGEKVHERKRSKFVAWICKMTARMTGRGGRSNGT